VRVQVLAIAAALLCCGPAMAQPEKWPVNAVAPARVDVAWAGGVARFPIFASVDISQAQPGITRAVLLFHGLQRNADVYFADALAAQRAAGPAAASAVMIAPQFLADFDAAAHHLTPDTLAWKGEGWTGGEPAASPGPISSFEAIDAILRRLADRRLFPDLTVIVVAGHSAGGQIVSRYAVVGKAEEELRGHIAVHYAIANPSSYLYLTPERPEPVSASSCPNFDAWKYGFASGVPSYVTMSAAALEARFVKRRVTYLLGTADIDPNHRVLDKSCAGAAQGPYRLARGHAFFNMLQRRHPDGLNQTLHEVKGVAHDGGRMYGSVCGLAAMFGTAGCP